MRLHTLLYFNLLHLIWSHEMIWSHETSGQQPQSGKLRTDSAMKQVPSNVTGGYRLQKLLKRMHLSYEHYSSNDLFRERRSVEYRDPLASMTKDSVCAVEAGYDCTCYFDSETNRSIINCRYANLYMVPPFSVVDKVYYQITFSERNFISVLKFDAFKNLKVERIDLLNNHLSSVQQGAFNGLETYLQELLLEGNGKDGIEVPFNTMTKLSKLRRLRMKNFRQDTFTEVNHFGYFPVLESLEVDSVSLKYISNLAFQGKLSKLTRLQFENVDFEEIPVESLRYLQSISTLYIRFTKISMLYSNSFEKLENLLDLDLSHNNIGEMQTDTFAGVNNQLTHLDLGSNKLEPNSLVALSSKTWNNLKHLTLSYNEQLSYMPGEVFKYMPNLQYLYLQSINLKHIPGDLFLGLGNVASLDLSWNNIETIQDRAFNHMNKLYELRLDHQFQPDAHERLLEISRVAFSGLENSLVFLFLENTVLKPVSFWNTVGVLAELKQLTVGETKLSNIPSNAFYYNKKLSKVELNGNGITYLHHDTFRGLEGILKEVSLRDNNLTTISECVFQNFSRLDYIHLRKNPLDCDCRLKWLHTFILGKQGLSPPIDDYEYICSKPEKFANQLLSTISSDSLSCSVNVPETCTENVPPTIKTSTPTHQPTSPSTTNYLKLTVASHTSNSITVAWTIVTNKPFTGFKLEYKPSSQEGSGFDIKIHKDQFTHTLYQLMPGVFYHVCLTAEISYKEDLSLRDCKTVQTFGQSTDTKGHTDNNETSGDSRNIIIGAIIATVAVVVLIAVGVCAVVRYKVLKLRELQFAVRSTVPRRGYAEGDDRVYVCAVPNEYSEIEIARIANKYNIKSPKHIQRQFGVDNFSFENTEDLNNFHTYQKIGKGKRKNPYENDDDDDDEDIQVHIRTDSEEVHFKNELEQRHSAPSRLAAADTKRQADRNSRPLPATPSTQKQQGRSSTLKTPRQDKSRQQRDTPDKEMTSMTKANHTAEKY